MRATEIIRNILDIIDQLDNNYDSLDCPEITDIEPVQPEEPIQTGVDTNRFKHIYAILDAEKANSLVYNNTPNEIVTSIASVTNDAGGGWNGPKNPADIKSNSISMYPNYQHKPGA